MNLHTEETVLSYCREHSLLTNGTILVALSGGSDSVALLHILHKLAGTEGFSIAAAHMNHGFRGDASDEDEVFCRNMCKKLNIPLTVKRLPEDIIQTEKASLETIARDARMAFLEEFAAKIGADRIATGHTSDDQAETVLQRILRGTGPTGLRGILPMRDNKWIRPLLSHTRNELREYLSAINCDYREDESNTDTAYFRNSLRHQLLPFIRDGFASNITPILCRLADLSREQESYFDSVIGEAYKSCLIHEDQIKILLDKSTFMAYHTFLRQRIVRLALMKLEGKGRDTDRDEIKSILDVFSQDRKTAEVTKVLKCESIGKYLAFAKRSEPVDSVPLNLSGKTLIPASDAMIVAEKTLDKKHVDGRQQIVVDTIVGETYGKLTVGTVHPGDMITPYGSTKTHKIRDLFSRKKIPLILRETIPVVHAGAVPIWIPGIESSDILRTKNTTPLQNSCLLRYENGVVWR